MSMRYFCSDLHLGHDLAARLRGFDSVEEHDNFIINTLTATLNKRDILVVMGDVAMDRFALFRLLEVPCMNLELVYGNHDDEALEDYLLVFSKIHGFYKYKNMWISHCPMHPQELFGRVNIHGHLHKGASTPPIRFPYINMNWDYWARPVSLNEIKDMVSKQEDEQDRCV